MKGILYNKSRKYWKTILKSQYIKCITGPQLKNLGCDSKLNSSSVACLVSRPTVLDHLCASTLLNHVPYPHHKNHWILSLHKNKVARINRLEKTFLKSENWVLDIQAMLRVIIWLLYWERCTYVQQIWWNMWPQLFLIEFKASWI